MKKQREDAPLNDQDRAQCAKWIIVDMGGMQPNTWNSTDRDG